MGDANHRVKWYFSILRVPGALDTENTVYCFSKELKIGTICGVICFSRSKLWADLAALLKMSMDKKGSTVNAT